MWQAGWNGRVGEGFSGLKAGLSVERTSFDTTDIQRGGTSQAGDGIFLVKL